ncbi:putative Zn-dependent protease, minimal metalloprotease (MMP)-like domain [Dehalogenimonas formicexedens]|uniref:Putative Zn-dependent protease, minimal metalloprotease (MMP)-like domain n=1 Tax=Dehalogenimonas formicexedens TaxID=1839801 RepID=A0A1P8F600_9CHLR|nr:metallopeptidase family protein [Dehalogenimonas formicexedens]APV43909.1 putative Zn-dependent protease, minimal metalloprotease (MMP)-like domain [Dehalogenimonas formicexedens]
MDAKTFSGLVSRALDNLPDEFLDLLENIEIAVEDYPSLRQRHGSKRNELLGLYEGVPLTERDTHYGLVLPDKITIFQKPIEAICKTEEEIIDQVEKTVRHEIAHHFGMTDAQLDEIEQRWSKRY